MTRRAAAMDEARAAPAAEVESALETARSVEARAAAAEQALSVALGQRSGACGRHLPPSSHHRGAPLVLATL